MTSKEPGGHDLLLSTPFSLSRARKCTLGRAEVFDPIPLSRVRPSLVLLRLAILVDALHIALFLLVRVDCDLAVLFRCSEKGVRQGRSRDGREWKGGKSS